MPAYERYELTVLMKCGANAEYHANRDKLEKLRVQALELPSTKSAVLERLAEPFDPGPAPSDFFLESHFSL